jgi:cold shock CspA family protein
MSNKNNEGPKRGKVIFFNESLGTGILRLDYSNEKIRFNYRDLDGAEGFRILFPGDIVQVSIQNGKIKVKKIGESYLRAD